MQAASPIITSHIPAPEQLPTLRYNGVRAQSKDKENPGQAHLMVTLQYLAVVLCSAAESSSQRPIVSHLQHVSLDGRHMLNMASPHFRASLEPSTY